MEILVCVASSNCVDGIERVGCSFCNPLTFGGIESLELAKASQGSDRRASETSHAATRTCYCYVHVLSILWHSFRMTCTVILLLQYIQ
jgi:hypothetical protein